MPFVRQETGKADAAPGSVKNEPPDDEIRANGRGNGHGQRALVQLYAASVHEEPADE
jgi:hypothetical protein